jgi:UDP-2-acetamido-3-amino-2,3-dideoxy-glucuronate N-acetyltransferase
MKNLNSDKVFIHETATIDDGCKIGNGTKIWHYSHILTESVIGLNCNLGQNVMIGPSVSIGDDCKIQNNVSVYPGVTLEDGVFCGPSMTFTNVLNPRSEVDRKHEFKKTIVKRGATLGANSTIVCDTVIGKYAFIGAGTVVTKDVPDYGLVIGNPGRLVGFVCACGVKLPDGKWIDANCKGCSREYKRSESGVKEIIGAST